jgi:hypothetical protein
MSLGAIASRAGRNSRINNGAYRVKKLTGLNKIDAVRTWHRGMSKRCQQLDYHLNDRYHQKCHQIYSHHYYCFL